jgi:hypothetical protein
MYRDLLKAILSPSEKKFFARLNSPQKVQDFLDSLPVNFEPHGETYMSPRLVLREQTAHCFEGALFAAAALAYHRRPALLMDLKTLSGYEDHVVALFRENGRWGAISKTNHAVLRYRDPVYESPRELAMSYFHEYFEPDGRKSLRSYSRPFDLERLAPERWVTAEENLHWLVEKLDHAHHSPIAPKENLRLLKKASRFEITVMDSVEWNPPRGRKKRS